MNFKSVKKKSESNQNLQKLIILDNKMLWLPLDNNYNYCIKYKLTFEFTKLYINFDSIYILICKVLI